MRRVAIAIVLAAAMSAGARAATPEEAFDRASEAYAKGRWDEAAEGFRGVLAQGVADARVEYNLAGAEFKRGKLAESILHYERARRLDPGDADTAANLALVRSKIRDVVTADEGAGVLAAVAGWQDRLGVGVQGAAVLAGSWIVALLLVVCASRPGGFTPARSWVLAASIAATIVLALSWRATDRRLLGASRAVVMVPSVEALAGPGLENTTLFTLHEGTTMAVRGEREGWLQVILPNGLTGWVVRDAAERI